MTFTYDGTDYRIGFQHERPRNWGAHLNHRVSLYPERFYCDDCKVELAGISPALMRVLKSIAGDGVARIVARELARNVQCTVYERAGAEWKVRFTGRSRLNTDAGDQYNRKAGRIAALRDALPMAGWREFKAAAMAAYLDRARRGRKAGGL